MSEVENTEWLPLYITLLDKASKRHREKIKIKPKSDLKWFWKTLHYILKIVTLGKAPSIYDRFFSVIGRTVWLSGDGNSWDKSSWWYKYSILSHELDHMDYCYFGDSSIRDIDHEDVDDWKAKEVPWYLKFWYNFKYLFWPFPILWAYGRQDIEIRGYRRNIEAHIQQYGEVKDDFILFLYLQFTSSHYLWMATKKRATELIEKEIDDVKKAYAENRLRFG